MVKNKTTYLSCVSGTIIGAELTARFTARVSQNDRSRGPAESHNDDVKRQLYPEDSEIPHSQVRISQISGINQAIVARRRYKSIIWDERQLLLFSSSRKVKAQYEGDEEQ